MVKNYSNYYCSKGDHEVIGKVTLTVVYIEDYERDVKTIDKEVIVVEHDN
jgi:hypothetical protein